MRTHLYWALPVMILGLLAIWPLAESLQAKEEARYTENKIVFLRNDKTYAMLGDRAPKDAGADRVLPYLLNDGWTVREIVMLENETGGYVILER